MHACVHPTNISDAEVIIDVHDLNSLIAQITFTQNNVTINNDVYYLKLPCHEDKAFSITLTVDNVTLTNGCRTSLNGLTANLLQNISDFKDVYLNVSSLSVDTVLDFQCSEYLMVI